MLENCKNDLNCSASVIEKQFLCCTDLTLVDWKKLIECIRLQLDPLEAQLELLKLTVQHPLNLSYPVKINYQRSFLKQFISQLEAIGEEVVNDLYTSYIEKLKSSSEEEKYHYCHYKLRDQTFISLRESNSFVTDGTTGLSTWEGGRALAEYCLQHPGLTSGKHVLELGCGLGLCGLSVSAQCRPASYNLTDCHSAVLAALRYNLQLNQALFADTPVTAHSLDWEHPEASCLEGPVDVVLAADVVYDERLFPALVNILYHFLSNKTSRAIIACTERNSDTLSTFLNCLDQKCLVVEELQCPTPQVFQFSLEPPIRIFCIRHETTVDRNTSSHKRTL